MSRGQEKFFTRTMPIFDGIAAKRMVYIRRAMGLRQDELAQKFNDLGTRQTEGEIWDDRINLTVNASPRLSVSQWHISRLENGLLRCPPFNTGQLRAVIGEHFTFFLTGEGGDKYAGFRHVAS